MPRFAVSAALVLVTSLGLAAAGPAQAETWHACSGFIDALPATITTQGTWCLRGDLSTTLASGEAITIAANNVTIDCNDYKIGGLGAGAATAATGIHTSGRLNATVRNCHVRGFLVGIELVGASAGGHLVEDNRLDFNTYRAIRVYGDGSTVRRNLVFDTGGSTLFTGTVIAINAVSTVDVLDNTVSGVAATPDSYGNATAVGIALDSSVGSEIAGNRVRGLVSAGTGTVRGIHVVNSEVATVRNNFVVGNWNGASQGVYCSNWWNRAIGNVIEQFATPVDNCTDIDNIP